MDWKIWDPGVVNCCITSSSTLDLVDDRHKGEHGCMISLTLLLKLSVYSSLWAMLSSCIIDRSLQNGDSMILSGSSARTLLMKDFRCLALLKSQPSSKEKRSALTPGYLSLRICVNLPFPAKTSQILIFRLGQLFDAPAAKIFSVSLTWCSAWSVRARICCPSASSGSRHHHQFSASWAEVQNVLALWI